MCLHLYPIKMKTWGPGWPPEILGEGPLGIRAPLIINPILVGIYWVQLFSLWHGEENYTHTHTAPTPESIKIWEWYQWISWLQLTRRGSHYWDSLESPLICWGTHGVAERFMEALASVSVNVILTSQVWQRTAQGCRWMPFIWAGSSKRFFEDLND